MTSAEQAYLFRHAVMRDAAYQLLLPEHRAELHALAIDALETLYQPAALDPFALELADHAAFAQSSRRTGNVERMKELAVRETQYLRRAAEYAQRAYRMDEAVRLWDRLAVHAALEAGDRLYAFNKAAVARSNSGRLLEAERMLREGIARGGEPGLIARMRLSLGVTLYNMARVVEAAEQYRAALPALEVEGPSETLARALMNLAGAEEMQRERDGVEQAYLRAAGIARQAGDRSLENSILANLGNLHHRRGRWPEAERDYLRSLEFAIATGDQRQVSSICVGLGIGLHEQGDSARAAEYLRRAIEAARAAQDRYRLGEALVNLAIIGAGPENHAQTRGLHYEALEIHRETGNVWGEATALIGLSDVLIVDGKLGEAREVLQRARSLAASVHDVDREGVALLRIALVDLQDHRYEVAAANWREARALLRDSRMHRDSLHKDMLVMCERLGVPPLKDDRE